jgi:hypothetical protein
VGLRRAGCAGPRPAGSSFARRRARMMPVIMAWISSRYAKAQILATFKINQNFYLKKPIDDQK